MLLFKNYMRRVRNFNNIFLILNAIFHGLDLLLFHYFTSTELFGYGKLVLK
jgi:hypothetical protein